MPIGNLQSEADLARFVERLLRRPGVAPPQTGVALIVAHAPTDKDFPEAPANGTLAVDSATSTLYCRIAGEWKAV